MPKKILVVDDDPLVRRLVKSLFDAQEFKVLQAEDGWDGLEKARKEKPDVILLDIMMPELDGKETLRTLKAMRSTSDIPVVLLTSLSDEETVRHAKDAGIAGYIVKPFKKESLIAKVLQVLRETGTVLPSLEMAQAGETKMIPMLPSQVPLHDGLKSASGNMLFDGLASLFVFDRVSSEVFNVLKDGARKKSDIAKQLEIPESGGLDVFLRLLTALGLTACVGADVYDLTPAAEIFTKQTDAGGLSESIQPLFQTILHQGILRHKEFLAEGTCRIESPEERRSFTRNFFERLPVRYTDAMDFLFLNLIEKVRKFICIAPVPENYAIEIRHSSPSVGGLLYVGADREKVVGDFLEVFGMKDSVAVQTLDPLEAVFPQQQDVIILGMQSALAGEKVFALFDKAAESLAPGGCLFVHDYLLDAEKTSPLYMVVAEWIFSILVGSGHFLTYDELKRHAATLKLNLIGDTRLSDQTTCLIFQK